MKKSLLAFATLLSLAVMPGAVHAATVTDRGATPLACPDSGAAVDESGFVSIGGIRQWVTIEGQDCRNPVVLMVHGGPGNPNTPFAHTVYADWTKDFTLVQWDQRGSGKTWGANPETREQPLSLELLASDGIEVARHIQQHLGKHKLILMGGSWGSALAVQMAQTEPELFHAYVGTAQLVSYADNVATSYQRVLGLAQQAGDAETVESVQKIGPPPWTNPRAFGILRRAGRKFEATLIEPAPKSWWSPLPGYDTPQYEADYEAGEDFSFVQFVGMAGDGMGPKLDIRRLGTRFAMPVYLLQGEQDTVTTLDVSQAYFDSISAPQKEFFRMPRTGHDPNPIMVKTQLEVLETRVRPAAVVAER
ncbi:alpha/beta fold hydrolase [Pseudoxanthomonas indica]|uniref:Proline iminopeptidase n=1 Tax=Pseudoxanthomonas indica TaxID=428993 RepID=A0A1T5LT07_9GAMM|nr:alpha/beta hydrolase [Pseudoxanthomonas indica]SKC79041.1 Pimeloyl-ACP methyl ester carboxylesterase [Pseudoxanthomonas indica]